MSPRKLAWLLLVCLIPARAQEPGKDKDRAEPEYAPYKNYVPTDVVIERYQAAVKKNPKAVDGLTMLGHAYLRKARESGDFASYDRADETFRRALELSRDDPSALSGKALVHSARHQFVESLRVSRDLARRFPEEAGVQVMIADALLELGEYDKAEKTYREAEKLDRLICLHSRWARLAELKGKTDEALRWFEKAIEIEAPSALTPEGRSWYPFRMGEICFNAGRYDKAAEYLEEAREMHPRFPMTLAYLGKVRAAQGKLDEAVKLYAQAVGISAELSMLADLGDLYVKTGKEFLARLNHDKLEKAAKGQTLYARELSLYYCNHDRNLPEALELARKDLELRRDVYTHDTLAWALYKNGKPREAAEEMTEALKLGTKDAGMFYHAGMIQAALGEKEKAREYLKRALETNPHFSVLQAEKAREALKKLGE